MAQLKLKVQTKLLRQLAKQTRRRSSPVANGLLMPEVVWTNPQSLSFCEMRGELQAAHFYFAGLWYVDVGR